MAADEQPPVLMGNADGGVLLEGFGAGNSSFLTYLNVHAAQAGWRFTTPAGSMLRGVAQGPDGTVFATVIHTETPPPAPYWLFSRASIVGLDGGTGAVKFEIPLPQSRLRWSQSGWCGSASADVASAYVGAARVDTNGMANVVVTTQDLVETYYGEPQAGCDLASRSGVAQALLYRVSVSGAYTTTVLHDYVDRSIFVDPTQVVLPDEQGGVLATWACDGPESDCGGGRARYVGPTGASQEFSLTTNPFISASNHVGYGFGSGGTVAFDMTNGNILMTTPGLPIAALDGGELAVSLVDGTTSIIGATGDIVATGLPSVGPANSVGDLWIGNANAMMSSVVGIGKSLNFNAGSPVQGGNRGGQYGPPKKFSNPEDAAVRLLWYYNPYSKQINREYGGLVCKLGAIITKTLVQGTPDKVNTWEQSCPVDGSTGQLFSPVADYHTHANQPGEGPSGGLINFSHPQTCTDITGDGDLAVANGRWSAGFTSVVFYMTTPSDSVYRYQGPVSQQNTQRSVGNQWITFDPCTGQ